MTETAEMADGDIVSLKRRPESLSVDFASSSLLKRPRQCSELLLTIDDGRLPGAVVEDSDADSAEAPRSKPSTLAIDRYVT